MLSFDLPKSALVIGHDIKEMAWVTNVCKQGGFTLHAVATPEEATAFLAHTLPSLILFMPPDAPPMERALDWLTRTRGGSRTVHLPIILIAQCESGDAAVLALDAGADDYVLSGTSKSELLARIRAVLRCRTPELAGEEIICGPLIVRPSERELMTMVHGSLRRATISPTEFRLLHFLVTHPETVHTRDAVRRRLWPAEQSVSERTVDAHVRRLRRSLARVGMQTLVETVLGVGYRLAWPHSALPTGGLRISAGPVHARP